MTFEDLKTVLFARSNFGMKLGLDRMREALRLLGDPQLRYPTLHVAGTNGKGSTCAFAEASLRAAGLRTGLYTSPHLRHFCERIRVGFEPIAEERAAALLDEIVRRVPWALDGGDGLTFFELATLMGFLAFAQERVDVAVIEVGLGGRLDATNVLEARACAIAPLGLEHTEYLGPTLTDIAREKAGILRAGAPAVTAAQEPEAAAVLAATPARWLDYAFDEEPFAYRGPAWTVRARLSLAGLHQAGNAALACALLEAAALPGVEPRHLEQGLATARWPGRLEVCAGSPRILVDGAHNPHAARSLARTLAGMPPWHLVFGCLQDKDAGAMLAALAPLAASVHFCAPDSPRARAPQDLAASWPGGVAHQTLRAALEAARSAAGPAGTVVCCGSLYLAGEVSALLSGEEAARMPSERL